MLGWGVAHGEFCQAQSPPLYTGLVYRAMGFLPVLFTVLLTIPHPNLSFLRLRPPVIFTIASPHPLPIHRPGVPCHGVPARVLHSAVHHPARHRLPGALAGDPGGPRHQDCAAAAGLLRKCL